MSSVDSLIAALEARLPADLDWLRQMVDTNSWTENREGVNRVGELTAAQFARLGFQAERIPSVHDRYGDHLILTRRGTGPSVIALISHLDTVFSPEEEARHNFHWQPEGNRIYGPGTEDIKGGTLMMWLVLDTLRELYPEVFEAVTWKLLWNSSEEVLAADFGELCRERLGPETRAALVFEAEGKLAKGRRVVVSRKGRAVWRVRVSGRASHAGVRPAAGASAIVQLGKVIERLHALNDESRQLSLNVGLIRGGTGLNRVPDLAEAEGEFRAFRPDVYAQAKAALLSLAGPGEVASSVDGFRCQIEVEILGETRPWPRNPATDGLLAFWQKAGEALGQAIEGEFRGGLSDGNHLWDQVPTLDGLGPSGDNDHCAERSADGAKLPEYVERDSFVPKAALNVRAIVDLVRSS